MKYFLLTSVVLLLHLQLYAQRTDYHISVTFDTDTTYQDKIYLLTTFEGVIDSAEIINGKCILKNRLSVPQLSALALEQFKNERLFLILTSDHINIKGNPRRFSEASISYTDTTDYILFREFQQQFSQYSATVRALCSKLNNAMQTNDTVATQKHERQLEDLAQQERKYIFSFVTENPDNYGTAIAIHEELLPAVYLKPDEFQQVYDNYSARLKNTLYGKALTEHIQQKKQGNPLLNTPILPFQLPDSTGRSRKLDDFDAGYYLIDIWASWCGPCRAMNAKLKKYYQRYHQQGFEIIGISVDQQKNNWIKAIQEDQTSWPQLLDQEGMLVHHYKIGTYPTNFILDKSGKIIGIDLYGKDLEAKLEELFPQKK